MSFWDCKYPHHVQINVILFVISRVSLFMIDQNESHMITMSIPYHDVRINRERRKKELKQMLLFEQQREKIKHDRQQQFEKDQIAEKKKRENKKKQEMRAADERRIRELRLKRREEVEEELARVHSRVQFEKDKKIRANMESKKASERKSLKKVEEEKKNRNNFKQIQIERKTMLAYLESQQRINEREEKELRQQEKAKLKKMRDHEVLERKRIDKAQKIGKD